MLWIDLLIQWKKIESLNDATNATVCKYYLDIS